MSLREESDSNKHLVFDSISEEKLRAKRPSRKLANGNET